MRIGNCISLISRPGACSYPLLGVESSGICSRSVSLREFDTELPVNISLNPRTTYQILITQKNLTVKKNQNRKTQALLICVAQIPILIFKK